MRPNGNVSLLLILVVSVSLIAPTVLSYHNSVGVGPVVIGSPDEVGAGGVLAPDVSDAMRPSYHTALPVARIAPSDQTGSRYTAGCAPNSDGETNPCYVGYLDAQMEYYVVLNALILDQPNDNLYPVNPEPTDTNCPTSTPEQRVATAQSTACQGGGKHWYVPFGNVLVDSDLMNAGLEAATTATGTQTASGSLAMPGLLTPYVYAFGRPHPLNPTPSPLRAGVAPFADLSAQACAPRTGVGSKCSLLTPFDMKARDDNYPLTTGQPAPGDAEFARLCAFHPSYTFSDSRWRGLCGPQGTVVDTFLGVTESGGLGIAGAPSTWINLKPGYYQGTILITNAQSLGSGRAGAGLAFYAAVNPRVPGPGSLFGCVQPNILGPAGNEVYGAYVAHAIDTDLYRNPYGPQVDQANAVVAQVQAVVNQIQADGTAVLDPFIDDAVEAVDGVVDQLPPLPPEVEDAIALAGELADDAVDRTDYSEAADAEPDQPGDALGTYANPAFPVTLPAQGLSCQGATLTSREEATVPGILRMDSVIWAHRVAVLVGVWVKDPTLLEGGLPAGDSRTTRGYWQSDMYTFQSGQFNAVYDSNENGVFDACAPVGGAPSATTDICPWRPLWDAYNEQTAGNDGKRTRQVLDDRDYDRARGVGMYFVLKTSGPTLLINENPDDATALGPGGTRTQVIGLGDPTGQNCIVGTSLGFAEKLKVLKNVPGGVGAPDAALVEALCGPVSGERALLVGDAFNNQSPNGAGGFSAAVMWGKVVPTPSGLQPITGGAGDVLCVHGVWSVLANKVAADTIGNLALSGGSGGASYEYKDCDVMTSALKPAP